MENNVCYVRKKMKRPITVHIPDCKVICTLMVAEIGSTLNHVQQPMTHGSPSGPTGKILVTH